LGMTDPWTIINQLSSEAIEPRLRQLGREDIVPGTLYLQAASLHLYERNFTEALKVLVVQRNAPLRLNEPASIPRAFAAAPRALLERLGRLRFTTDEWWFHDLAKVSQPTY